MADEMWFVTRQASAYRRLISREAFIAALTSSLCFFHLRSFSLLLQLVCPPCLPSCAAPVLVDEPASSMPACMRMLPFRGELGMRHGLILLHATEMKIRHGRVARMAEKVHFKKKAGEVSPARPCRPTLGDLRLSWNTLLQILACRVNAIAVNVRPQPSQLSKPSHSACSLCD
jgi:hypothetical protein